jgi:hypothetical protein
MVKAMITLADLLGAWRLTRRIIDHRAGLTGALSGTCHWRPYGNGLRQEETGVLIFGTAPPMQASRTYLWRAEGASLVVFFEDGRPFHRLVQGAWADRHHCAPDIYDVTYDFSIWPDWTQVWHVSGPRKEMTIESRFQPLG